jgi:hypothetical protein
MLARPRLQRAMPLTRDTEVLEGKNPSAGIDDRCRQRPLMRIDADHVAGVIGRDEQMRRPRTALSPYSPHLDLQAYGVVDPRIGRQHPGRRPDRANAPIKSDRSSMARTEVDTSERGHRPPGQI